MARRPDPRYLRPLSNEDELRKLGFSQKEIYQLRLSQWETDEMQRVASEPFSLKNLRWYITYPGIVAVIAILRFLTTVF